MKLFKVIFIITMLLIVSMGCEPGPITTSYRPTAVDPSDEDTVDIDMKEGSLPGVDTLEITDYPNLFN